MDALIDRRELMAKARERRVPLAMVEKDYVLGWVLFGVSDVPELVFKGGSALAKVYFPEAWRLSEDLDFAMAPARWEQLPELLAGGLRRASVHGGMELAVKSQHLNPGYLQLKVQYSGPLGRSWLKVDVTSEAPIGPVLSKPLSRCYSDYPDFAVNVESLEEILSQKLRALVQRKKVRDYYDVWRMTELDIDHAEVCRLFPQKLQASGIRWHGLSDIFPGNLEDILSGYWEKELGRLVYPVPEMRSVLVHLAESLAWLGGVAA